MKFAGLSLYYYICISTKKRYCKASTGMHYKAHIFLKQYITFIKNKEVQKKLHFTMHMERILHSKNNMNGQVMYSEPNIKHLDPRTDMTRQGRM